MTAGRRVIADIRRTRVVCDGPAVAFRGTARGALSEPNFRRYFFGRVASNLGDLVVPVALAFAVLDDLNGSASDLGLVFAAATIPKLVLVLAGGVWADRLSARRVMLGADIVRLAIQGAIALLLLSGNAMLWHLIVGQAAFSCAAAFFDPASTGIVPQVVSPAGLQQANALIGVARSVTHVGGPALAAVIIATTGTGVAFVVDATSFAVSAWSLAGLPASTNRASADRRSFLHDLTAGWREFVRRSWVWSTVVYFGLYQAFVLAPYLVLGPVIADRHYGGASGWAMILAAGGAGAILSGLAMARFHLQRPLRFAYLASFAEAPALVLIGLAAPLALVIPAVVLKGAVDAIWGVAWFTALQEHIPAEAISRVSAYDEIGSIGMTPISFAVVGVVAEHFGAADTMIAGALLLVSSTLLFLAPRSIRRLDRTAVVEQGRIDEM